jgi:hypothetical protein
MGAAWFAFPGNRRLMNPAAGKQRLILQAFGFSGYQEALYSPRGSLRKFSGAQFPVQHQKALALAVD